jgi:ABC-2 type transport system ATP-binding protein
VTAGTATAIAERTAARPKTDAGELAVIEVAGLVKEYPGGTRALDGIDVAVAAGEFFGFLGPNGAGKTTTIRILATLIPPTAGRASVAGLDVVQHPAEIRRRVGFAMQAVAVDLLSTGRENLELIGRLHRVPGPELRRRVDELLELMSLTEVGRKLAGTYSGGMKRRLDLALALAHRPRILFLDEPTTGLDIQSRTALWEEVSRLAGEDGVTVFLTTQYLEEADALADRVGIIDHGKLVAEGTPAALKEEIGRPTVEAVPTDAADHDRLLAVLGRFGELAGAAPNGAAVRLAGAESQLAEVVRALDAEGISIEHLQLHAPSLDDVFLTKTGRSLEGAEEEEAELEEAAAEAAGAA